MEIGPLKTDQQFLLPKQEPLNRPFLILINHRMDFVSFINFVRIKSDGLVLELFVIYECRKENGMSDSTNNLSNWGRWGADDMLGTLNLMTQKGIKNAAGLVKKGKTYSLSVPLETEGPQWPLRQKLWQITQFWNDLTNFGGVRGRINYAFAFRNPYRCTQSFLVPRQNVQWL